MNSLVELLRYLLIMVVCLYHYNQIQLPNGFHCVEFFFILSGFLLAKSALGDHPHTPRQYITRRFWQFSRLIALTLPLYVAAFYEKILLHPWKECLSLLLDVLCLGGIFSHSLNFPLWYISALFWSNALLYLILRKMELKKAQILITFLLLSYVAFIYAIGKFNSWDSYIIIYRGMAETGIGILLYMIRQNFSPSLLQNQTLWIILTVVCLLRVIWMIVSPQPTQWIDYCMLFSTIILGLFTCPTREFPWVTQLGRLSLYIYVIHIAAIRLFNTIITECSWQLGIVKVPMLILFITLAAMILQKTDLSIQKYCDK